MQLVYSSRLLYLQNNPLYIEAFEATSKEEVLRFHNIAHCSLDAVEKALEDDKSKYTISSTFRSSADSSSF